MQFVGQTPMRKEAQTQSSRRSQSHLALSFYKDPPSGDISIQEFESLALDRLRVLKYIEDSKLRNRPDDVIQTEVKKLLARHLSSTGATGAEAHIDKDVVSHFILLLAYCKSSDLRHWCLQYECELFRCKFKELLPTEQLAFTQSAGLPYNAITDDEFDEVKDQLVSVYQSMYDREAARKIHTGEMRLFYKVPFTAVPDLVSTRKVLLRQGSAYVGPDQLFSLVVGHFRAQVSRNLTDMAKRWNHFMEVERNRLGPLIETLPTRSLGREDGAANKVSRGTILAANIPYLAQHHFPLCMYNLYEQLHANHHLKHWGRQHLSLFLKTIGLPLEQALHFFRTEFCQKMSTDQFDKEYAYNFRYNYGKEGKKTDYTEYSCVKICQSVSNVQAGEHHGCPYKTFTEPQLRAALLRLSCSESVVSEVLNKARDKHYQLACALAFEGIHRTPCNEGINKPSEYFEYSMRVAAEQGKAEPEKGGPQMASGHEPVEVNGQ